jgi:Uma2 family endonuclease
MVAVPEIREKISLADFLILPETKPAQEYINGRILEKTMPQGEHSILQTRLVTAINQAILPDKLAHAFTELRCTFAECSIVPDIAIFYWERIPKNAQGRIVNRFEVHPDWIIEILSPEQSANRVIKKIIFCLEQGTQLAWLIDPEDESITIFELNKMPKVKANLDILPVLAGMQNINLSVQDIFSWLNLA